MMNYPSFLEHEVLDFLELFPYETRDLEAWVDVETGNAFVQLEWLNNFGDWIELTKELERV